MYINRTYEQEMIEKFIDSNKKIIFIDVKGNSGFSSFWEEQLIKYKTYHIIYEEHSMESFIEKLLRLMKHEEIKK